MGDRALAGIADAADHLLGTRPRVRTADVMQW